LNVHGRRKGSDFHEKKETKGIISISRPTAEEGGGGKPLKKRRGKREKAEVNKNLETTWKKGVAKKG